jgi:hypothetical protein
VLLRPFGLLVCAAGSGSVRRFSEMSCVISAAGTRTFMSRSKPYPVTGSAARNDAVDGTRHTVLYRT